MNMLRLFLVVAGVVGGSTVVSGCTDLDIDGPVSLSCENNDECPQGFLCAPALSLCVDEAIVAETPIAVEGDVVVDALRISRVEGFARTVATVTFSKAPVGAVTALVDNRIVVACEADDAGVTTQRCSFDARDVVDEADGAYDIVVVAKDAAGNEARGRARFEIDTAAPAVAPGSVAVSYSAASTSLVRDVDAVGPASSALVQLSVTEVTAIAPTLVLVGDTGEALVTLVRDDARSAGPLHVFNLEGAGLTVDNGVYALRLTTVDDVGNAADIDTGATIVLDSSAPRTAITNIEDRIVFVRVPWGTRGQPLARFEVRGAANAAEPGATVIVTSAAALTSSLLGSARVAVDGSFTATLQVIDVPRVFVRVVDGAGNVGEAVRVQDIEWTASLGGRLRGDDFSNPHALFTTEHFDDTGLTDNLQGEPLRPADLVDSLAGIDVEARADLVEVRTTASGQPARMAGTLGYLPALKAAVLFGGVGRRNGGQLTDTFVLRNETWQSIAGEHPSAVGPFAYDTTRETLVTLVVTGETWSFDGFRWRELPAAPPTTTARGPIAFDPIEERLVALLGTQTWVLDNDDAWRQLDDDAPVRGVSYYDGNDSEEGAVLAFDGVNGHVTAYGDSSLHALIDDVWTRIADAPASTSTTAVEDPTSGRVHFVCRGLNRAVLTWDGTAFTTGPVDTDQRSACNAAWDTALDRLIMHGGTNDPFPNVQALSSNEVRILDDGASSWRGISEAAPTPVLHNFGGTWHDNPILDRTVFFSASTGANESRSTTLWDGSSGVAVSTATRPFTSPFFDGINSRAVGFNSDLLLIDGAWVTQARAFTLPNDAIYAYDDDADAAFGFGGRTNSGPATETFRLRGNQRTVLPTTTQPPPRDQAKMRYDLANGRMIYVGNAETWAFEDNDWHQLDDLPLSAIDTDTQLLFDRARGVMMGFIKGRLFELRGAGWVERVVDTLPRKDALAVFDKHTNDLLFIGGLDFEFLVNALSRIDIAGARAAAIARFDITAVGASDDAEFATLGFNVVAGATGGDVDGAEVLVWDGTAYVSIADIPAPASSPSGVFVLKSRAALGVALREALVVAVRSAPTGAGTAPASLALHRLEVTLRYREP